ncbi:MAG: monovalent cation/H(+) antiporter subunit G [Staphylococcus epidermidis]|nr:monovalent cation/H(+) antiporter subunit G [Staphylococcus epidermidis]
MEIIKDIVSLIASILIFLGSIIALISAIGIVKFQDVFLRSHASTKSSTLSVLLTVVGVLIYFIVNSGFFSVRLLLEFNTPEELKKRAKLREERREKLYYKEKEYINKMDD